MKRTIEVTVSPTGTITVEAVNFKGADCEQATRFLEAALGQVDAKTRKPEFHQRALAKRTQHIGS